VSEEKERSKEKCPFSQDDGNALSLSYLFSLHILPNIKKAFYY